MYNIVPDMLFFPDEEDDNPSCGGHCGYHVCSTHQNVNVKEPVTVFVLDGNLKKSI